MRFICPLCKQAVDEDDAYRLYRESKEYKEGVYPDWAYYRPLSEAERDETAETLLSHFVNFHRLPHKFSACILTGYALGKTLAAPAESAERGEAIMSDLEIHLKKAIKCLEKAVEKAHEQRARARDHYEATYLFGVINGYSWALRLLKGTMPCPYDIGQEEHG
jgi:hypothetical protein